MVIAIIKLWNILIRCWPNHHRVKDAPSSVSFCESAWSGCAPPNGRAAFPKDCALRSSQKTARTDLDTVPADSVPEQAADTAPLSRRAKPVLKKRSADFW
ncbi:hypothetical protein CLOSYM_03705 [[Clostridium] symbiosum ATCC 14940]|uniref:Uncharacterized protein n=1 Tax=[Clostridium] symbiosum ATCC 14940 TaxID=411472 RepID=A0ABC9TTS2_CLOSY|nr:hypothetical protein CLOSYM_03705 [[Clostridium] symbiosum ATCC 14940]